MERVLEIGKAFAVSLGMFKLSLMKVAGRHGSSFNHQREVSPMAMEASSHEQLLWWPV
jgi:hypothetical protein